VQTFRKVVRNNDAAARERRMAIAGQRLPNRSTEYLFVRPPAAVAAAAMAAVATGQPLHAQQPTATMPTVQVIGPSPLIGSGIDPNSVPAATHVFDYGDIRRQGVPDLLWSLNQKVGAVSLDSASGNPFQPTFNYRGFAASPLQGRPQGLAVYINGMRFNQPFGDTVDWDLIPNNAIDRLDVEGSNPVFGLNALGGSINVQMKNGFTWQGGELGLSAGSFGQRQSEFQWGRQFGSLSAYLAGTVLHQDGWRDLQSSDLQNAYGDLGWRGSRGELHLNFTVAHSDLNGPGTSPVQLLAVNPSAQFTAPNFISNSYTAVSLNGTVDLSDQVSLQGLAYYRYFLQNVINGNAPNDTPCTDGGPAGFLCTETGVSTTFGGVPIPDFLNGAQYSVLDTQRTSTNAYGAAAQVTDIHDVFGLKNHFVAGVAFDGAHTRFNAVSYIGGLTTDSRTFIGPGIAIDEPAQNSPVSVGITNAAWGVYVADSLKVTDRLTATVSGRFNAAFIDSTDFNGGDLSGSHSYLHFNPAAGLTYDVAPWLTVYGGYAMANRAPTPAELSCSSAANSCSLANFFVGDPDLRQVVAQTFEAGLRGNVGLGKEASLRYSLGLFLTNLDDDIVMVNSPIQGRAFFTNVGSTRRQGLEADLQYTDERWRVALHYALVDATFQSGFTASSELNPAADANGNITVQPGNHLPGIPRHQLKASAYYKVTDKWTVGATLLAGSGQYLFGDEANLTPPLAGYVTLGASMSYRLLPNLELFAWAQNITDTRYYTFGTFSPTSSVFIAQAPGAGLTQSYSPAAPFGIFGGLRAKF
jgi:outer membrane receptor protein involved in Fe transport